MTFVLLTTITAGFFMLCTVAMPWSTPAVTDPTTAQEQGLESNGAHDRVCRAGEGPLLALKRLPWQQGTEPHARHPTTGGCQQERKLPSHSGAQRGGGPRSREAQEGT